MAKWRIYTRDLDLYPSLSLFPWSVVRLGGTDHEIGDKRRYRSNPLVYLVFGDLCEETTLNLGTDQNPQITKFDL